MKNTIAGILTAITILATFASPALAVHPLSGYPSFLLKNGMLDAYVVVGQTAASSDVVGAVDVAVRLGSEQGTTTTSTSTSVSGGKSEDLVPGTGLNANTAFGASLDYSDLAGFQKATVSLDIGTVTNDYDVHDELDLTAGIAVNTGLTVPSPDEDFGTSVFLNASKGSIEYKYVFDDTLKAGNYINDSSSTDSITISFLGKDLTITGATATAMTVQVGDEYTLQVGESVTVEGKKVTLENVGSGTTPTILIDVDGVTKTVSGTQTVNGLQIKVKDTFYSDVLSERVATLVIGKEATKSYTSGDAYIGEDKDDPNWVWDLAALNTNSPTLGVKWYQTIDTADENPPSVGECYQLPTSYKFATICLDKVSASEYLDYTIRASTEDLYPAGATDAITSKRVITLEATTSTHDAFTVGAHKTDAVAINTSTGTFDGKVNIFWKDADDGNKFKEETAVAANSTDTTTVVLNFRDGKPVLDVGTLDSSNKVAVRLSIEGANGPDLHFYFENTTSGFTYVGHSTGDTVTANDILYGAFDVSGFKKDTRTADGLIVYDPDGNAPGDKYKFSLPEKYGSDFKATVIVSGPGTVSTTTTGGSKVVVPVKSAIAKLDTEVDAIAVASRPNLVVVGGPAVNKIAAGLLGVPFPSYGAASLIPENAALLQVFDGSANSTVIPTGKIAILCAGWAAENTRTCTSVLQQYDTLLAGQSASAVKITSATSAGITPV
jgi:hypothetical protein